MGIAGLDGGSVIMLAVSLLLLFLGIFRKYEPLLLVPIGFGMILANLPMSPVMEEGGLLAILYEGVRTGLYPPLIFLGVGAMTDFGPLIANPRSMLLGAAAQVGIFLTFLGANALQFTLPESAAIASIGGADGPTAIFITSQLAPELLAPIAISAYAYMALVPMIQPRIALMLTSSEERSITMGQLRDVNRMERLLFPVIVTAFCGLIIPTSIPLIGSLMFGNLLRESGVTGRLSKTAQNELINIVTIFLGLTVGATAQAATFLTVHTIMILLLGVVAFSLGTASGVLFGKAASRATGGRINPLIGAAGVSAVPMAARVVQKLGQSEDPNNFLYLLPHPTS